ncbi:hypothetical protein AVEN_26943-1 [Araneus ventricosus]|uniref:Uncharacterized protein n=1 Tax=Araneus ventricosus TaxID=182803 RepID=A0A4Y2WM82_ARAVE|nr:hypothetical protein AVEN_26943-1 [Araneus ventricosus]
MQNSDENWSGAVKSSSFEKHLEFWVIKAEIRSCRSKTSHQCKTPMRTGVVRSDLHPSGIWSVGSHKKSWSCKPNPNHQLQKPTRTGISCSLKFLSFESIWVLN